MSIKPVVFAAAAVSIVLGIVVYTNNTTSREGSDVLLLPNATTTPKVIPVQTPQQDRDISGTYVLVSFDGEEIGVNKDFVLSVVEGRLSISFCNSMSGAYSVSDGEIQADMMSTLMYCSEPEILMTLESEFGNALSEGAKLKRSGNYMIIEGTKHSFAFLVQN